MKDVYSLENKLIVVTGGGTGIGFAISKCFIEQDARVIISGRREEILISACKLLGENCKFIQSDLTVLSEIPNLVSKIEREYGAIEVLVNNAGIHLKKDFFEVTDEEFEQIILVNQKSVFALSREVAKYMADRRRGSIIMISSMASQYGIPRVIAYTASKSAVEGMTRAMVTELSPFGIRVNCIAAGFIKTEMSSTALDSDPERKNRVLERTPLKRLGEARDIGNAAVFLASEAASFINGVILPVDGGNSIGF
jgi:NAD(P)-dependent dehydrogenase (short-subunit alcohol dehydrogenase family)